VALIKPDPIADEIPIGQSGESEHSVSDALFTSPKSICSIPEADLKGSGIHEVEQIGPSFFIKVIGSL
jgi:hypothetical protein